MQMLIKLAKGHVKLQPSRHVATHRQTRNEKSKIIKMKMKETQGKFQ